METPIDLRAAVVRAAEQPTVANQETFRAALPHSRIFVQLRGVSGVRSGDRYEVPPGASVRMPSAQLPNGLRMVKVCAAPPRRLANDEVIGTMTGLQAMQMTLKTPADGLLVSAEDERDSWTALTRQMIAELLKVVGES